jgi:two-component system, OmpR family, sensor kinase
LRNFFPRVFLVIWAGAALTGAAVVFIEAFANPPAHLEERHNLVLEAVRLEANLLVKEASLGHDVEGPLRGFRERTGASIYLFHDDGVVFAPKAPPDHVRQVAEHVRRTGEEIEESHYRAVLVGLTVPHHRYVAVGRIKTTPAWARAFGEDQPALRVALLLVPSGLLALLLARYLVRPVRSLRRATRRLAQGELGTRVSGELDRGVLAELGADFDAMAARVEALLGERQRVLSDVAHELNSPLARLRVALELARRRAGPDAAKALNRIEREAERLGGLVDEILTFSRLARDELPAEPVELAALLDEVARDAAFEVRAHDAEVRVTALEDATVRGDGELLRRTLDNVVRNALRFTAEGTTVELALRRDGDRARVEVRDRGPGVPEDMLEAIFEPLFRVEPDRARAAGGGEGTGLGLAIARRAADLHGGAIHAANHEGGGLLVTLTLPIADSTGGRA